MMKLKNVLMSVIGAAVLAAPFTAPAPASAEESLYLPSLVYRTGPFAPGGVPFADGFADYWAMVNERDGGVGGAKVIVDECEFGYNTDRGVECYERTKNNHKGALVYHPLSTGVTYALADRTLTDKIPVVSMGYGRSDAGDGAAFPYVFPMSTNYWGQATAILKYMGDMAGGSVEDLKGKKVALVYLDIAYGKEPIPLFEAAAKKFGFEILLYPVSFPGIEQKATWLQIRRARPDYITMWGWGVMNQTAIKEAANINFPMDHFIGNWWSGAEIDTVPAGGASKGYKSAAFSAAGKDFPVIQDIEKYVYAKGKGAGKDTIGTVLYNRAIASQVLVHQGIKLAQEKFGVASITAEQLRWGLENVDMTPEIAASYGAKGIVPEITITCENHVGTGGGVKIQQWDGGNWSMITDWIEPMHDMVQPAIKESADKYLKEKGLERVKCS